MILTSRTNSFLSLGRTQVFDKLRGRTSCSACQLLKAISCPLSWHNQGTSSLHVHGELRLAEGT